MSWVTNEWSGFVLKMPTANVPQIPQVRWTESAPTGSSILTRSKSSTDATTMRPAIRPMSMAALTETVSAPAVMPTSPASAPFSTMLKSGLCWSVQEAAIAPITPAAAASDVVTKTSETSAGSALRTDPPLNPYQPSHRRKTPIAASGMLCPAIGRIFPPSRYLPRRGPRTMMPASPAQPPTEWTSVEPAKS